MRFVLTYGFLFYKLKDHDVAIAETSHSEVGVLVLDDDVYLLLDKVVEVRLKVDGL